MPPDEPPPRSERRIDIPFDVDLGELIEGHRVIARGIEFARLVEVRLPDPQWLEGLMRERGPNGGGYFNPSRVTSAMRKRQ